MSAPRRGWIGRNGRVRAAFAAVVLTALAASGMALPAVARAADPPGRTVSPADSAARSALPRTAPYKVMLRSAVVPGWGQLYNHQPLKAALVVGAEGILVASAFRELKKQNDAIQRAAEAEALGDEAGAFRATLEADTHRNRKISWIWWGLAAHLLSMADAYVDAHLSRFAADDDRRGAFPALPEEETVTVALRVRF